MKIRAVEVIHASITKVCLNGRTLRTLRQPAASLNPQSCDEFESSSSSQHHFLSLYSSTLSTLAKQLQLLSHPSSSYPPHTFLLSSTMVVQTRGARLVESIHNTFQVLNQRGVVEVFFHPTTQNLSGLCLRPRMETSSSFNRD